MGKVSEKKKWKKNGEGEKNTRFGGTSRLVHFIIVHTVSSRWERVGSDHWVAGPTQKNEANGPLGCFWTPRLVHGLWASLVAASCEQKEETGYARLRETEYRAFVLVSSSAIAVRHGSWGARPGRGEGK
jgi:hypothetical protein